MAVIGFDVQGRELYLGGQEFGEVGAYERIDGLLHFAVDPEHPANAAIVDLKLAESYDAGRVRFQADFCVLRPVDAGRGNRRLLLELPNRGRKLAPRLFNRAPSEAPPTANILPGDGFLMRHGFAVGWIGWQWDVVRSDALMGLIAPVALQDGQPIRGQTIVRFQPNVAHQTHLLADRVHQPYPAADLDDSAATLTVRDFDDATPETIARNRWRFAREDGGEVVPDAEHIYLESGFEPGRIYELVFMTDRSPVVGAGLLALRDAATWAKNSDGTDNPLAGEIDRVYGWGMSQTGRMLRHYLFLGLNLDEGAQTALDGVIPHVGGGRRGEFNHRYGQPSVQYTPGFGHLPPFDDAGLLERQRALGGLPKVMQTNSSAEYWRGDCALMHVDSTGEHDLVPDPETRTYHFAGTQHGPGAVPLTNYNPNDGGRGRYGFNCVEYTPLMRAALVNLDRWVSAGTEPPANAHPRLGDNTATSRETVVDAFSGQIGIHIPDASRIFRIRRVDVGGQAGKGIGTYPVEEGERYPSFVAAVNEDLNELGGVRLPDLTVPVGTHTGWNPRDPETGAPDLIMPMQGMTLFFHRTRAEREAAGDARPSLEERYVSRDDYLERVRAATNELVEQRYVLEEDVETIMADAGARYEEAMGTVVRP